VAVTVAPDEIVTLFGPIPRDSRQPGDRPCRRDARRAVLTVAGQAAVVLPAELATGPATVAEDSERS
jgi:hypothetical protein